MNFLHASSKNDFDLKIKLLKANTINIICHKDIVDLSDIVSDL